LVSLHHQGKFEWESVSVRGKTNRGKGEVAIRKVAESPRDSLPKRKSSNVGEKVKGKYRKGI